MTVLLFGWESYQEGGGWNDLLGIFDTVQQAQAEFDARTAAYAAFMADARRHWAEYPPPPYPEPKSAESIASWTAILDKHSSPLPVGLDHGQIVVDGTVVSEFYLGIHGWETP